MSIETIPIEIRHIETQPIEGQKPGTSGLRKQTRVFMEPPYAANFLQAVFDVADCKGKTLILGGDGRFYNREVVQLAIGMAVANGVGRLLIGRGGILSTPATSHLIRKNGAAGGIILSASHNAGGIDGDFGIKFNVPNGGPAPEAVTEKIYARTQTLTEYLLAEVGDIDIDSLGEHRIGGCTVEIIDPVADYADLMEQLFDFAKIRSLFERGFQIRFDAMHAVTGPYAVEILQNRLNAPEGSVMNAVPLPDFNGGHPDPNPVHAHELMEIMQRDDGPSFGAASDGDGDRNLILGPNLYVTPSDSLAVLAANARCVPAFSDGLKGIARSMPTSRAADHVADALGIDCFETPTGWKFFGNLLDAGKASICGEESAGTGADHIREKDGLWAVLFWLNLLAVRDMSMGEIMRDHWQRFGRHYFARHDYENVESAAAAGVIDRLQGGLDQLAGRRYGPLTVESADNFAYSDPVDQSVSSNQGLRIFFEDGSRAVMRLSGTGTQGATIRLYLERYVPKDGPLDLVPAVALKPLVEAVEAITDLHATIGRDEPDVIS